VPHLGHFPDGLSNLDCYDRIINDFFMAGTAASVNTACLATMQPPPFFTEPQPKATPGPKARPRRKARPA